MNRRQIMMACSAKKAVIYTITANITNGSIDKTFISAGESLEITLTPSSGYKLPTDAPTASNGTISGYDSNTGKFILSGVTANTTITTECPIISYTIITTVTNGTYSGATEIVSGGTATVTITPNSGYKLPDSVSVSGATSSYDSTTGVINLSNPTSDVTITVSCPSAAVKFSEDTWENIAANCEALENASMTEEKFCSKYLKDDGSAITSMNDFVGLERSVTVNGRDHKVRVIGTQHDILSSDNTKRATLTFEFKNLLSDSDGNSITTFWNRGTSSGENNYDYLNSSIYKCMEGAGNGGQEAEKAGIKWYKKGETVTTTDANIAGKTVLQMLPSDLVSKLKQVTKKVGISTDSGSTYVNQTYNCKLFNLSYRETTASGTSTYQSEEGTAYAYYTGTRDTNADRIKKQVNNAAAYTTTATVTDSGYSSAKNYAGYNGEASEKGNGGYCWLRSPNSYYTGSAWYCSSTGLLSYYNVYYSAFGVAPAFCL